jgi:hypothetical protein
MLVDLIRVYLNFGGFSSPAGTSFVENLVAKSLNNEYAILLVWQQKKQHGMRFCSLFF